LDRLEREMPLLKDDIKNLTSFIPTLVDLDILPLEAKLNLETYSESQILSREFASVPLGELLNVCNDGLPRPVQDSWSTLSTPQTTGTSTDNSNPSAPRPSTQMVQSPAKLAKQARSPTILHWIIPHLHRTSSIHLPQEQRRWRFLKEKQEFGMARADMLSPSQDIRIRFTRPCQNSRLPQWTHLTIVTAHQSSVLSHRASIPLPWKLWNLVSRRTLTSIGSVVHTAELQYRT
jgi:hypothetical protein